MESNESMEVAPSADSGNVPAETVAPVVAPNEPAKTDAPAVKEETAPAATAEPELFELPDGRKVDAATLTKEWKENFLPDYTRKSQALAAKDPAVLPTKPDSPYADPSYVPQTYEEIIQVAKERALQEIDDREQKRVDAHKAVETAVESQLTDIKKTDPQLNENALFQHAVKYGFKDLKLAHQNMKDMSATIKAVKQQTATDIAKRNDPVSVSPGATGARPNPSQFSTSQEYLRALKGTL